MKKVKPLNVHIETVTPVNIGNGEKLSPYSDYIFDDGKIYFLDHRKVEQAIARLEDSDAVMDEYVERIMAQSSSEPYSLKKFFQEHRIDYKKLHHFSVPTSADIKYEEIHESIKSGSQLYIPGSSIKGAIRTALLFHHRIDKGYTVQQAIEHVTKQKIFANGADVFGKYDKDVLKYLHISDTNLLPSENRVIVKTIRYDLEKQKSAVPVTLEAIPASEHLSFRLQSKAQNQKLNNEFHDLYQKEDYQGEKNILHKLNSFTKHILENELEVLEGLKDSSLSDVLTLYRKLYQTAENFEKDRSGAVMRIGSGKTFYDNTILSMFTWKDQQSLLKKMRQRTRKPFPKTRSVIQSNGIIDSTLGWLYLTY